MTDKDDDAFSVVIDSPTRNEVSGARLAAPAPQAPRPAPASSSSSSAPSSSSSSPSSSSSTASPLSAPAPGNSLGKLGRYNLVSRLGKGGMAEVFLATQDGPAGFQKQVVIKKSDPELAKNQRFVDMFLREAKIAALLNHSNVVQVFELGQEGDTYFIAMEHIDGISLHRGAKRAWSIGESIPMEVIVKCCADAARGLHYAHHWKDAKGTPQGFVHRDISPDNLMLTRDGVTKVLDFGIAKMAIDDGEPVTKTGEIKGKIPYMSPEQLKGEVLDGRADLWSLGVTLYWLLTGARPFAGGNEIATLQAILHDAPLPPRQVNPLVPLPLERLTLRLLEKDRARRFATGAEVADALLTLLGPGAGSNAAADFALKMLALDEDAGAGAGGALRTSDPGSQSVQTVVAARPQTEWLMKAALVDAGDDADWRGTITGNRMAAGGQGASSSAPASSSSEVGAFSGGAVSGGTVSGGTVSGGTVSGGSFSGGTVSGGTFSGGTGAFAGGTEQAIRDGVTTPKRGGTLAGIAAGAIVCGALAIAFVVLNQEDETPPGSLGTPSAPTQTGSEPNAPATGPIGTVRTITPDVGQVAGTPGPLTSPTAAPTTPTSRTSPTSPTATPSTPAAPAMMRVATSAPDSVRWEGARGKTVGKGSGGVLLPPGTKQVTAVDGVTGGRTVFAVTPGQTLDYGALARGRLAVRAQPWADVKLGAKNLGTTPFDPLALPPGEYKASLTWEGKVVEKTFTITAGKETVVAVNMTR